MSTMNISEYAQHTGVNRKTISRWMKSGKYIVMLNGEIDVESSDKNLKQYRDSHDLRTQNAKKKPETHQAAVSDTDDFQQRAESLYASLVSNDQQIRSLEASRAIKEHYLAELVKLEYSIKSGEVLPWQDMINQVGKEYARMRTRLIVIAPEHGPRLRALASTVNDAEFVAALREVIYEAMEELSLDDREQGG
ncbi:RNA polymerase subunit sigma-70 [Arsenophonus nasoniae]|uniref:RNA polymerase subunit sigma-70 n=1 Tax=Arsenophonus nasoniae TaxID=638 RepID=A0AA95GNK9_9GAMM|nr:RNA polymerase subunit sigma-70 [Arsenophonus nasoniae]WGM00926.1 RNA polymerase subunit sigma-70 [Arsenophonus nasoniae]